MVKLIPHSNGTSRPVAVRESLAESTDSPPFSQATTDCESPFLHESSFTTGCYGLPVLISSSHCSRCGEAPLRSTLFSIVASASAERTI